MDIDKLPIADLYALQEKIQQRLKEEIQSQHSEQFIEALGLEALTKIPVVQSDADEAGNYTTFRGLDRSNRPFIAIKVDLLDQTGEKAAQVVEKIFKRYSLDGDGKNGEEHGNNYVTTPAVRGDDGKEYPTGLYNAGGMSKEEQQGVGRLLRGEVLAHPFRDGFSMRLAKN